LEELGEDFHDLLGGAFRTELGPGDRLTLEGELSPSSTFGKLRQTQNRRQIFTNEPNDAEEPIQQPLIREQRSLLVRAPSAAVDVEAPSDLLLFQACQLAQDDQESPGNSFFEHL
jgi:hypothetical protein